MSHIARTVATAILLVSTLGMPAVLLVGAGTAHAKQTAEQTCQKERYEAAAKYAACFLKAMGALWGGEWEKFTEAIAKCTVKYAAAWPKLQKKATGTGAACEGARFVDNGNGTVTDNLTGLQWEQKTDDATVHDKDNTYSWGVLGNGDYANADGTAFTSFLATLNSGGCFAGQCGWRLPTFMELQTILAFTPGPYWCTTRPCIDPVFGPTALAGAYYWSSTVHAYNPDYAWVGDFSDGFVFSNLKLSTHYVRVVRGCLTPTLARACPSKMEVMGTSGSQGVLDTGWTGLGHNSRVVSAGKITVNLVSCQNATEPCGTCELSGPVANVNADKGDISNQRCTGDTRTMCTSDGNCSSGTCEFYVGTYLPLAADGVSTCVGNQIDGSITGTANINETGPGAGTISSGVKLTSHVYIAAARDEPCPHCDGDTTTNDGIRGGTCHGGKNNGLSCDVNGESPNIYFGKTSLDCQPLDGTKVAELPINLAATTDTATMTLSASSPNCRAAGFTTRKCFCDTCNNMAATPCSSNADCGGGICGGKRCQGGPNNGNPCSATSECTPGVCSVPGQATAPNDCSDANCSSSGGNEGSCAAGPVDQYCGPTATFQICYSNSDCAAFPGDTCQAPAPRPCFMENGASVSAIGRADPPMGGESDPTLASLFCVGPTSSGAVNVAFGLPGLGRLELPSRFRELP